MNNEQRRSRRNRFAPTRQRMVDPDAWTPDGGSSPHPPAEELPTLPVPTPSSIINLANNANDEDAPQPLITQPADPVAAAIARRQNTVVTVTSTQFSGVNPNNSSSQGSDGVPIGTIAASVSVGVFLAVSIVGCWWWFCKRPYTKRRYKPSARPSHKNQTSTSSVAPLNSAHGTKTPGQGASPRSREKPAGLKPSAPHSHTRSTSGGPPNGREHHQQRQHQQQRRPGQPAVPPPAVLPPSTSPSTTTTTPPNPKRRSPPGQSAPSPSGRPPASSSSSSDSAPASPASTLVEEPSTTTTPRRSGSGGKTYTPQKPSPLALGAERAKPKGKPIEKSKVNEWATGFPVSNNASGSAPSSPTRSSSSSGHGRESTERRDVVPPPVPPVPSTTAPPPSAFNAGRQSANLLAIPEPAAHYSSRRDRISVLSDSSYYALDPDEEDGGQHVYMGVALGGDEPSPIPEEYFSPNYGEEEEEEDVGRMQRHQEDYFASGQGATYGGYGQQQQRQQQQSYGQQPSQYQSQGGYGYGYGYSSNPQSYGR